MKSLLFWALLACSLILTCSDNGTDPTSSDPDPADQFDLTIAVRTDDAHSSSKLITVSTGGTISTTDANGVIYSLIIPAYSLEQTTTITLTPLDSFSVDGDVSVFGLEADSTVCPPGLLCTPSHLVFDSGATLSMQLPAGYPDPTDSTITMIYFDTSDVCLFPLRTEYDSVSNTYSSTIRHFSGYTTVNVPPQPSDCELLQSAFQPRYDNALAVAGTEYFVDMALMIYELKASNVRQDPYWSGQAWLACPSFDGLVDNYMILLVNRHWERIQEFYAEFDVDNHHIGDLIDLHGQLLVLNAYAQGTSAASAVEQALTGLHLFISNRLRAVAAHGQQLCQTNDCKGKDYLSFALGYGTEGWIVTSGMGIDNAYLAQLEQWIDDCCDTYLNVSVSIPGPTTIKRYAVDPATVEADQYQYICSLLVRVERGASTPAASVPVRLFRNDEERHFTTFTTNEDGIASFLFNPEGIDWLCQSEETWQIRAEAYESNTDEWFESDNSVSVTFLNQAVTTTVNYTYTYDWDSGGDPQLHWTAGLSGGGTGTARTLGWCASACEGQMDRTYSGSEVIYSSEEQRYVTYSWNSIGPDSVYACRANLEVYTMEVSSLNRSFKFITGASVSLGGAIFAGLVYEWSYGRIDTVQYGLGDTVWPEEPLHFLAVEGGVLGDTTWTWNGTGVGEGSVVTATLHVTVTAEE